MALLHPELTYSFRRRLKVMRTPTGPNAVLARIEQLLVDASTAFSERRYREAIDIYQEARRLLWAQLFPSSRLDDLKPIRAELVKSFVSIGAEWMNVLPIEQAVATVRPRVEADVDVGPTLGLSSASIDSKAHRATADLKTAEVLAAQGNTEAAKFFRERATSLSPRLVTAIGAAAAEPVAGPSERTPSGGVTPATRVGRLSPTLPVSPSVLSLRPSIAGRIDLARRVDVDPAPVDIPPELTVEARSYATRVGDEITRFEWSAGDAPAIDEMITGIYDKRRLLKVLPDILIRPDREADAAVGLAHAWYYETTLGLAECYHALGDWTAAQTWYLSAASYQYLNVAVEVPYVWTRLANLYLDWGNALFRADEPQAALEIYEKVLTADAQEATSQLYTLAGLKSAADQARNVIANLETPDAITASPAISSVVFDVHAQLTKIMGGLDFWGHWAQNIPIWTFDYLQSVAVNFCQLAIGAERDAMTFWEKADQGQLTRVQLTQSVAVSKAERDAAQLQVTAAAAERDAYVKAQDAANLRADNARDSAADYTQKSRQWTMHQALSAQLSGGEDGSARQLNRLADRMIQGGYSISGDRGTLAAAESLVAARLQREYEIDVLNRQAAELDAAAAQAGAELNAATARVKAVQASANASQVRVQAAQALIEAFDDQRFTPDVWHQLGERMDRFADRYLAMALDIAKRMQRSYNFENDVARSIIKTDYSSEAVHGLLAADALMVDVQSFTYDLVTSTAPKPQPIRQTISLAQRYPFLFETQLRATGRMEFQTDLDDFDSVYPGSYAGRIEHVEVFIDGIVPPRGVSGALTNSGISHYRLPNASWPAGASGVKHRVQNRETMLISDYDVRTDAILTDTDRRRRRVFEGAGVASAWTLELPPEVNELDYQALVDVRLQITYEARFDPDLRGRVLTALASRPAANQRQRPIPLRWLFPDAFFSFYSSGVLDITLGRGDFAAFERDPELTELSLLVTTTPRARASGVVLSVTAPGGAPTSVTTDADGIVPASALAAVAGNTALGDYRIAIDAADNPTWATDGALDLDPIANIALVVGYSFTPRT